MLKELWSGNIRLVIVFWIYGVLVSWIYRLVDSVVNANYIQIIGNPLGHIFIGTFVIFPLIYFPFIFIAIWRSADKHYAKSKWWAGLAQLSVVLWFFSLLGSGALEQVGEFFSKKPITNEVLYRHVIEMDKNLPQKINQATMLTHASVEKNVITFYFQVTDDASLKVDPNSVRKNVTMHDCDGGYFNDFLLSGGSIDYVYKDNQGNVVNSFSINEGSCH